MNKLKRRFPNFFSGFTETEHEFTTKEELLKIDWVDGLTKYKDFHKLSIGDGHSSWPNSDGRQALMVELEGGHKWFVVGWLWLETDIDLPKWEQPDKQQSVVQSGSTQARGA